MAKLVSKTYGDALLQLAVENGKEAEWLEEARGVLTVLKENEDLAKLMEHPKIIKEEKEQIIENIFKGRIADELVGLMRMLVEKDHFREMEAVFTYFIDMAKERLGIGTAYVTSAMELSDSQKGAVLQRLLDTTDYDSFEMHYQVDSSLIGGMVIRIRDRVVDSSIRTKLQKLSSELTKIQLKAGECAS
ncbi:MAG: ATP synthase F1 subunit delta [Roseburia sp.]